MPPYEKPKTSYDFITKPPDAQKPRFTLRSRLPIIAAAGVGLLILLFVVLSVFSGGPDGSTRMLTVAQQQTELVRVGTLGTTNAGQTTKNIALNVTMTASSDQQKLIAVLAENGVKFKNKQLAAGANPQTDASLTAARSAANFDATFAKTIDSQLADYQAALEEAHANSGNEKVKKVLSDSYSNAKLLRTQIETSKL